MGIIEIYLAIGIVVAIFCLISIFGEGFDEEFENLAGFILPTSAKVYIVLLTVLIWPYTVYRIMTMNTRGDED